VSSIDSKKRHSEIFKNKEFVTVFYVKLW